MSTEIVKLDAKAMASRIISALAGGLVNAAKIYQEYLDNGGDPMELRKYAPVSPSMWSLLSDVASGRIDPRITALPVCIQSAVRQLPAGEQAAIIDSGVDVLAADGSAIRVPLGELTKVQASQAFGVGIVRSASEQAAYLKAMVPGSVSVAPARSTTPYDVRGNRLVINEPVTLTVSDLHRILGMMG